MTYTHDLQNQTPATVAIVQIGSMGIISPADASAIPELQRDDWVVCETGRGLEIGLVRDVKLNAHSSIGSEAYPIRLVRLADDGDRLAQSRLVSRKSAGLEACSRWLSQQERPEMLLDVDVTLDGHRIYFHFLGDAETLSNEIEEELASVYDKATGIREFTSAVQHGCGPTCGSDGSGCHSEGGCGVATSPGGGCSQCGLKNQCGSRREPR